MGNIKEKDLLDLSFKKIKNNTFEYKFTSIQDETEISLITRNKLHFGLIITYYDWGCMLDNKVELSLPRVKDLISLKKEIINIKNMFYLKKYNK